MNDINDYELLSIINDNEEAKELLFEKYRPLIISVATKIYKFYKPSGYDMNDLIQEGMIGIESAINFYDQDKNSKFSTYVRTCVERKMLGLIKQSERQKNLPLNESHYIEKNPTMYLHTILKDELSNPSNLMIENENITELITKIKKELSTHEEAVFDLKINGFENDEIAQILDKDKKTIVNTLCRVKNKMQMLLNKR